MFWKVLEAAFYLCPSATDIFLHATACVLHRKVHKVVSVLLLKMDNRTKVQFKITFSSFFMELQSINCPSVTKLEFLNVSVSLALKRLPYCTWAQSSLRKYCHHALSKIVENVLDIYPKEVRIFSAYKLLFRCPKTHH